jgi:predicted nucleotidyltransferase
MGAGAVIERRRGQRRELLARAERFGAGLDSGLGVRAVVVFGSVARGDFNLNPA